MYGIFQYYIIWISFHRNKLLNRLLETDKNAKELENHSPLYEDF